MIFRAPRPDPELETARSWVELSRSRAVSDLRLSAIRRAEADRVTAELRRYASGG